MAVHPALAADLMLINGRLLTMDSHNPVVQAVAVKDGKIVAVGDTAEVEVLAGATTQVLDLDGRTAMPASPTAMFIWPAIAATRWRPWSVGTSMTPISNRSRRW